MLGMFLLIQLSIVGGDWLRRSVLPALAVSMRSRMTDPSYTSTGNYCSNFQDHVSSDFYFTDIIFCIDLIPTCLIMGINHRH
jgi:hypothetical protein